MEAFRASKDFWELIVEFNANTYLARVVDRAANYRAKVEAFFSNLDVAQLDAEGEPKATEVDRWWQPRTFLLKLLVKTLFKP